MTVLLKLIDSPQGKSKFRRLYEKYIGLVMHIALKRLNNNQSLAEEAAQETFLYLAKNFHKVGDVDSMATKSFVSLIASAFAAKCFHREFEKSTAPYYENGINYGAYCDIVAGGAESYELKSAVENLNEELRMLVYLKFGFGFENQEICKMCGMSDYMVRKKLRRALAEIRKQLEKED